MKFFFMPVFMVLFIAGCSGTVPSNIGIFKGKLTQCPESPNCISSQSIDKKHFIEPINYSGSKSESYSFLILAIKSIKGSKIITKQENYIHAEFTSRVFKFVDDTEFLFDDNDLKIDVRSASRKGYYDFGANRKRIEKIRKSFDKQVTD